MQEDDIVSEEDVVDEEAPDTHDVSPTLLLGWNKPATIEELLSDVPPRQVTDRLIYQFINLSEPIIGQ